MSAQHTINFVVIPLSCYTKFHPNLALFMVYKYCPRQVHHTIDGGQDRGGAPRRGSGNSKYICVGLSGMSQ